MSLDQTRELFQTWLHLPDTGSLDVVLGTVAANRIDGDPVWLLLVGPPGGGKSEVLNAVSHLPDAHPTGTLTEAALLSGTPKKEQANDSKGGLLRAIGDRGIIVCKDFGSVLSMNRDARSHVLAALREVYDGAWTRHVGTDGGRTLAWAGRVGLIGGCTPTIDRHHAVMGAMGERFTFYRLPPVEARTQARRALGHSGKEKEMRRQLQDAADSTLAQLGTPRSRTAEEDDLLISLATLVVRARSAVERDGYRRDIELVPGSEAPTRLVIMLARLLDGLDAIGCDRNLAMRHVQKVAFDSVPALRLAVLRSLHDDGTQDTNAISETVRHPTQTTRRSLEDLVAHGLVECTRQGDGKAHIWSLSTFATDHLDTFPEMSEVDANPSIHAENGERDGSSTTFPEKSSSSLEPQRESVTKEEGEGGKSEQSATDISGTVSNGHEPHDAETQYLLDTYVHTDADEPATVPRGAYDDPFTAVADDPYADDLDFPS